MHVLLRMTLTISVGLIAAAPAVASVPVADLAAHGDAIMVEYQQGLTGYQSARTLPTSKTRGHVDSEYSAVLTVFSSLGGGAFLNAGGARTYTFGTTGVAGDNVITAAPMRVRSWHSGNEFFVSQYSLDSSELLPSGVTFTNGNPVDRLQVEVGRLNAGANPIELPVAFTVLALDVILFKDGVALATLALNPATFDFSAGLVATVNISGVPGFGIDEAVFRWTLDVPTPGSAALFGLAGLVAIRRRR